MAASTITNSLSPVFLRYSTRVSSTPGAADDGAAGLDHHVQAAARETRAQLRHELRNRGRGVIRLV